MDIVVFEEGFQEALLKVKDFMTDYESREPITECERSTYAFILNEAEKSRKRSDKELEDMEKTYALPKTGGHKMKLEIKKEMSPVSGLNNFICYVDGWSKFMTGSLEEAVEYMERVEALANIDPMTVWEKEV